MLLHHPWWPCDRLPGDWGGGGGGGGEKEEAHIVAVIGTTCLPVFLTALDPSDALVCVAVHWTECGWTEFPSSEAVEE